MLDVSVIETEGLGDHSYVLHDGSVAVVVDPQRDLDRVERVLDAAGVQLTHVLETHVHNDYVTGGLELARRRGSAYVLSADEAVSYPVTGMRDGDELVTGRMRIRAVHTPGHTHHHLSYVVAELTEEGASQQAVCTGGSLLYGTVGRPDLLGPDHTSALAHAQHRSARRLADLLADEVRVLPTHGFGSFCSSIPAGDDSDGTLGRERHVNAALTEPDEDAFVERLLAGLTAFPRYYAHMAPANRAGPAPVDLSPPASVEPAELRRRVASGQWVVDVRTRSAFAAQHLPGSVNVGLDGSFATYLGWTIPWGMPVTLVGDTAAEVADAQRELVRIGIDRPLGQAVGGPGAYAPDGTASFVVSDFPGLARAITEADDLVVVDVRRDDEWDQSHLDAGELGIPVVHIPLPEVADRADLVPAGVTAWVHCKSGFRSSLGASLLKRAGREVVLIDDEVETAADAGLPMTGS